MLFSNGLLQIPNTYANLQEILFRLKIYRNKDQKLLIALKYVKDLHKSEIRYRKLLCA